jgi:hypothetical protein
MTASNSSDVKTELQNLLTSLFELGKELPQCLFSLTQIVQPQIPNEMRIPLLSKMFTEVPSVLQSLSSQQLQQLVHQPRADVVALRLLLDIFQVQKLLQTLSYLQLLHLSNNMLPPGSPQQQLDFLLKIQEYFQYWSNQTLQHYHEVLTNTPLHLERQQLLELEPQIPLECLHLLIDLIKLPLDQLQRFKQWIDSLSREQLILLVNLLQMEPAVLIEIKRRIANAQPQNEDLFLGEGQTSLLGKRTRHGNTIHGTLRPDSQQFGYEDAMEMLSIRDHPSKKCELPSTHLNLRTSDEIISPLHSTSQQQNNELNTNYMTNVNIFEWEVDAPPLIGTDILPDVRGGETLGSSTPPQTGVPFTKSTSESDNKGDEVSHSPKDSPQTVSIVPQPIPPSLLPTVQYQLQIAAQPPAKTVYQRILKPFPAIMLLGGSSNDTANLFVEATLIRSDSETELPLCLDGSKTIRISSGIFAVFKKLKILSTSQQQGTLFRLRFQLRQYSGTKFESVPNAYVISNPIEVFSHTQYLNEKKNVLPPPNVTEVLPAHGSAAGNTRCVVLGSNFVNSPELRVKFGEHVIVPIFHESGTLICSAPPGQPNTTVHVRVANDGKNYCETYATFSYTR